MLIDCASCVGRPTECGDCVISVVLGSHSEGIDLDADEQIAVAALAGSGLVPPLRLMPLTVVSSVRPEGQPSSTADFPTPNTDIAPVLEEEENEAGK